MDEDTDELPTNRSVVCAHNEWDLLEEAIVGNIDGATVPSWHLSLEATMPPQQWKFFQENGGKPFPKEQVRAARKDLEEFVTILEHEGVTVKRPEVINFNASFATPYWQSSSGLYAAMPRDVLLVVGDKIIEAPMAWRSRYFEIFSYRKLIKEYFKTGAKWLPAPKPEMSDALYNPNYRESTSVTDMTYAITEYEPTFDAADFLKLGKDIIVQKSHVTNQFGIEWVRSILGNEYRVHVIQFNDTHPMHIDATLAPLAPGKLLVNPERIGTIPSMFKDWHILEAPLPCIPDGHPLYMTSKWLTVNTLSLDHERVIVEKNEEPLIKALRDFGMKPILCSFRSFNTFGGSFHCATIDIRRRGELQSYF